MTYIEDYLEWLCNNHLDSLKTVDAIYFSIYKQTVRGIGLTDRQYNLITNKINEYTTLPDNIECKVPLRKIDRSKYIKIVSHAEMLGSDAVYESFKSEWKWIKVRFPFSKKHIVRIDDLKYKIGYKSYHHVKGSHEHYFRLEKDNVFTIVNNFQNFDIEDEVLELYNQQKNIKENNLDYIPFLSSDNQLQNINFQSTENYMHNIDRAIRYGYAINLKPANTLTEKIAYRQNQLLYLKPEEYTVKEIINSLHELDRFPIIVLIDDDNTLQQVQELHNATKGIVNSQQQSVLFRVDSNDIKNMPLNLYIKENELNNWVDNDTKIVYIKKTKLPKILLKSNFKPICALSLSSIRSNKFVSSFCVFNCDCYIMTDNVENMFFKGYNLADLQTYN